MKCLTCGLINFIIQTMLSSLSYHASYFLYSSSISGPQFPLRILPNFSPFVYGKIPPLKTSTPSLFSSYFHLKHSKTLLPISTTSKLGHQWTQFCQIQWSTLAIHCISAISHVRVFPFATWNHTTIISHSDYYTNFQLVSLLPHFPYGLCLTAVRGIPWRCRIYHHAFMLKFSFSTHNKSPQTL